MNIQKTIVMFLAIFMLSAGVGSKVYASEITGTFSLNSPGSGGNTSGGGGSFVSGNVTSNIGGSVITGNVGGGNSSGRGGSGGSGGGGGGGSGFSIVSNVAGSTSTGSVANNPGVLASAANSGNSTNNNNASGGSDFSIKRVGDSSIVAIASDLPITGNLENINALVGKPQTAALSSAFMNNPLLSIWLWILLIVLIVIAVGYNNYRNRKITQIK